MLTLGEVVISTSEYMPMTLERPATLIRRSEPDVLYLGLPVSGTMKVDRMGRATVHHGDSFVFLDSWHPFVAQATAGPGNGRFRGVAVQVPRRLLPVTSFDSKRLFDRRLSTDDGVGALLAQTLVRMSEDAHSYRPDDGHRLGTVLVDLMAALFAQVLDTGQSLALPTRQRTLILHIREFIRRHLGDPELTPGRVAAAHHISTSYLHRLFTAEGVTVGALIRRQRLQRVRRDLADPALRGTPIHAIAARWGFLRAADFSRTFRTAYGLSAREFRNQVLRA